jgi:hypothetical protein
MLPLLGSINRKGQFTADSEASFVAAKLSSVRVKAER